MDKESRIIYIFDEIDSDLALEVHKAMDELERASNSEEIQVKIMSPGGDWFDGLSIYDRLRASTCPIRTIGHGLVASTATAVFQAGKFRDLAEHCVFLIHDGTEGFEGEPKSFEAHAEQSKKSRQLLYEIYASKSGRPSSFWQTLCLKDTILDAEATVKWGLADRVLSATKSKRGGKKT
jgi:ATP-dependent Clp protease, protease subunit